MRHHLLTIVAVACLAVGGCAKRQLTTEEQRLVSDLEQEVTTLQRDIGQARALAGQGLVGAMASVRLEVLLSTEALLKQRIAAIESGAPLKVDKAISTVPADPARAQALDAEIARQEQVVTGAERKAGDTAGLVGAMAAMTVATERQTLATLRMQYVSARYGLPPLAVAAGSVEAVTTGKDARVTPKSSTKPEDSIVTVTLLRKRLGKSGYQDFVTTDLEFKAAGLDKPARAIKGTLTFRDLFGEAKMSLGWTIEDPVAPGQSFTTSGSGFEYNQFKDEHQWVASTAVKDITTTYRVSSIIYGDGTRVDFDE